MSPVKRDIPALILQQGLDSQIPLTFGKAVSKNLKNSFFLEWPSEVHVIAARGPDGCASDIAAAFLDQPKVKPDYRCSAAPYDSIQFGNFFARADKMLVQEDSSLGHT